MSNQHIKEPAYWPEEHRGSSSQVTQNMPKKYTILAEIKVLQDRLQDMYTNRSDIVNVTGDGWAAAHQNEIKEIFWVYLKALGWISGLHGAVFGTSLGVIGSLLAGVFFEVGLYGLAFGVLMLSSMVFIGPFIYLTYAEIITIESGKWVVGSNTKLFHDKMIEAMQFVISNTWLIALVVFVGMIFLLGLFDVFVVKFIIGMLGFFRVIIPEDLYGTIVSNGQLYGIGFFIALMALIYFIRTAVISKTKKESSDRATINKQNIETMKYKDNVQEVRFLFD